MLSEVEIEAIRTLVGQIAVEDAVANPNVFNEAVERAFQKILEHYQLEARPVNFSWELGGVVKMELALLPKGK